MPDDNGIPAPLDDKRDGLADSGPPPGPCVSSFAHAPGLSQSTAGQGRRQPPHPRADILLLASPLCASRLLQEAAVLFSRWYSILKDAVSRERARQQSVRDEQSLKRSVPVPYVPPPLTDAETALSGFFADTVSVLFGPSAADYARDHFGRALSSGDMRAFKIRLLFLKARDALSDAPPLRAAFRRGMEDAIDEAERLAGCIPDPSPRRLSRREQERRRFLRQRAEAAASVCQELPLQFPGRPSPETTPAVNDDPCTSDGHPRHGAQHGGTDGQAGQAGQDRQDANDRLLQPPAGGRADAGDASQHQDTFSTPPQESSGSQGNTHGRHRQQDRDDPAREAGAEGIASAPDDTDNASRKRARRLGAVDSESHVQYLEQEDAPGRRVDAAQGRDAEQGGGVEDPCPKTENPNLQLSIFRAILKTDKNGHEIEVGQEERIPENDGRCDCHNENRHNFKNGFLRKAREYDTVEQILDDIDEGRIIRYESEDAIALDLRAGRITPVDALMFTDALGRYVDDGDGGEDMDGGEEDGLADCDDVFGDDDFGDRDRPGVFSYNPRGFGGCGGRVSSSGADWNSDDEW